MKTIIISGSPRKNGDTTNVCNKLATLLNSDFIHLADYNISQYDYDHNNSSDDFIPLMQKIIEQYDTLLFVTPVYWYSMSGTLKVFFDRITDLLTIEKELGRALRHKNMAVVSSSNGNNLGEHFWLPFTKSAEYLGINYLGNTHTIANTDNTDAITNFTKALKTKTINHE